MQTGLKSVATMIVLKHEDEFLLLKRNKMPNAGMYVPVGGKVDPYERPIDTAIRETMEEAQIELTADRLRYGGVLTETAPTNYNWLCFIFIADIERVPPPPCNEGTLEWIPRSGLLDVPTPPTDWQIYEYLLKGQPFALDVLYDAQLNLLEMREEISGQVVYPQNLESR
ncbi:MAG: NUDIX domain-containing protein [Mameliella sp.]|nr:NUDIX domain-containing protein [Phaeodactylibacter sp.]